MVSSRWIQWASVGALVLGTASAVAQPAGAASSASVARTAADTTLVERLRKVEADPNLTAAARRHGGKVAAFCAHCHGENGNSVTPDTPNLAGQNPTYLIDQMQRFADGRRRNEFMQGLIKAMSPDEKIGTVLFYAQQPVTTQASGNAALVAAGKAYYERVCFRCHGAEGRGNEQFARLAGQQVTYVTRALKRYRDGSAIRSDPLMAASTKMMTDRDIDAVAAYVASMP